MLLLAIAIYGHGLPSEKLPFLRWLPCNQFPVSCSCRGGWTQVGDRYIHRGSLNALTTDDAFWRRQTLAACYQLAQSVSRKGGTGECTPLGDSAWRLLQLAVEKPWSAPGGPFACLLAQTGVENAPFTL